MGQTFVAEGASRADNDGNGLGVDREAELRLLWDFQDELARFRSELVDAGSLDAADILPRLSAIAARIQEMRVVSYRMRTPKAQILRRNEIDPLREDLDFHFRVFSRVITHHQFEWEMSRG